MSITDDKTPWTDGFGERGKRIAELERDLAAERERTQRLEAALERWIPEADDCEEQGKDEHGDAILVASQSEQLKADRGLLAGAREEKTL